MQAGPGGSTQVLQPREVQNRSISGPRKRTDVLQNVKKEMVAKGNRINLEVSCLENVEL